MGLIQAKCTNCGANIEVDQTKEAGICGHCGMAFVTEKVINNFNVIYNTTNINYGPTVDDAVANGEKLLAMKEFEQAEQVFYNAIKVKSDDYRLWKGLIYTKTHNLKKRSNEFRNELDKFNLFAPPAEKEAMQNALKQYKKRNNLYDIIIGGSIILAALVIMLISLL